MKANEIIRQRRKELQLTLKEVAERAGVPDQYIIQRLGHSGDSTLKRVYRHTLEDHEKAAVAATLEHFGELIVSTSVSTAD